jgi:hypothetical protein
MAPQPGGNQSPRAGCCARIIDTLHGSKTGPGDSAELSPLTSMQLIAMLGDARKRTLDMVPQRFVCRLSHLRVVDNGFSNRLSTDF